MDKQNPKNKTDSSKKLLFFESKDIKFLFQPTIDKFFTKYLNYSTESYIFHSQININNDEEKSFIFLTKTQIVFTQVFTYETEDFKENPILFKIDYSQVNSN